MVKTPKPPLAKHCSGSTPEVTLKVRKFMSAAKQKLEHSDVALMGSNIPHRTHG